MNNSGWLSVRSAGHLYFIVSVVNSYSELFREIGWIFALDLFSSSYIFPIMQSCSSAFRFTYKDHAANKRSTMKAQGIHHYWTDCLLHKTHRTFKNALFSNFFTLRT